MIHKTALFKFNGGRGALLCSECRVIIKTGIEFTPKEWEYFKGEIKPPLPPQYCEQHKTKPNESI